MQPSSCINIFMTVNEIKKVEFNYISVTFKGTFVSSLLGSEFMWIDHNGLFSFLCLQFKFEWGSLLKRSFAFSLKR